MARDLYGMSDRLADLGAVGRGAFVAQRASFVTWMTPATTPVVVLGAACAVIAPELAASLVNGTLGDVAFGAGAVFAWAALAAIVFWMLLDTQRDRILTGCLVAGALVATAAALVPPGTAGLGFTAAIVAVAATAASVLAVGIVTHESRMRARGRVTLGAAIVVIATAVHAVMLQTAPAAPLCAALAVSLFAAHVVGITALLSGLEDRLPNATMTGVVALAVLLAGAAAGLRIDPGRVKNAPLTSAAARAAERAAFRLVRGVPVLVDDLRDDGTEVSDRDAAGARAGARDDERAVATTGDGESRTNAADVIGLAGKGGVEEPSPRAALQLDDERSWTAARTLARGGEDGLEELVLQSLCDPRPDGVEAALTALKEKPTRALVRRLRVWLACDHRGLVDDANVRTMLELARRFENDAATRLALDLAMRTPDRGLVDAGLAVAARRLRRDDMARAVTGARAMATAARLIESGRGDDVAKALAVARESRLAARDELLDLLEIQAAIVAGDDDGARSLAAAIIGSNEAGPWLRRLARSVANAPREVVVPRTTTAPPAPPNTIATFFARRAQMDCETGSLAPGIGPGALRIGWRFTADAVPTEWTFLEELAAGGPCAVVVPGFTPDEPGDYTPELVSWRPGSPPRVLLTLPALRITRAPR